MNNKFLDFYFKKKYFLSLLVLVIIGFAYNSSAEKIVSPNSSRSFFIGMLLFILVFLVFFYFKKKAGLKLLESSLFWGLACSFLFFWSFNYLNIQLNNKKPIQVVNCEFNGTTLSRMTRGFYFSFKGETKFISGFYDFMKQLESKNYENDLFLTVRFSEGWGNSYIIHSWKVMDR